MSNESTNNEGRDRMADVETMALNPLSLVGSYFHRLENGTMIWSGQVVAEPQPGTYLLSLDPGQMPAADTRRTQVVVTLQDMGARDEGYEYRFYDTQDAMVDAYAEYLVHELSDVPA